MKNRRLFLKKIVRFFTGIFIIFSPFFSSGKNLVAKTKKFLVPKGTKLDELIYKNPDELITKDLEITSLQDFSTMGQTDHIVNIDEWRLEITGEMKNPVYFSYQDLLKFKPITRNVLLICPGFFALHGKWKGMEMNFFLDNLNINKNATHIRFTGPKGPKSNTEIFPLKDLLSNKVFLAYEVNDMPLSIKHGFPLRIVAEEYFGGSWIKYVDDIKVEDLSSGKPSFQFKDR